MTTLMRNPRVREGLGNFVLVFLSVGIVILYSSYRRPLWTDELLQYDLATPLTLSNALDVVRPVIDGSGGWWYSAAWFVSLLQMMSLSAFGADSLYLRLPSLIAGAVVIISCLAVLRNRGLGFFWQLLLLMAMLAQSFAFYYFGEARPYALLAAAVSVVVWYYVVPLRKRRNLGSQVIAYAAILIGSFTHLFFVIYLAPIAFLFAFFAMRYLGGGKKVFLRLINIPLLTVAFVLTLMVNIPWILRHGSNAPSGYDAFEFTRTSGGYLTVWLDSHFQFLPILPRFIPFFFGLMILLFLFILISYFKWKLVSLDTCWSASFLALLLLIPAGLSLASVLGGYQILNRQWIASLALVPLAFTWLISSLYADARKYRPRLTLLVCIALMSAVFVMAIVRTEQQVDRLRGYQAAKTEYLLKWRGVAESDARALTEEIGWEVWNINAYVGGPVWKLS